MPSNISIQTSICIFCFCRKNIRVVVPPPPSVSVAAPLPNPIYPLKTSDPMHPAKTLEPIYPLKPSEPIYPSTTLAPTPMEVNGTRQSTSSTNTSDYFSMNSRDVDYHQVSKQNVDHLNSKLVICLKLFRFFVKFLSIMSIESDKVK